MKSAITWNRLIDGQHSDGWYAPLPQNRSEESKTAANYKPPARAPTVRSTVSDEEYDNKQNGWSGFNQAPQNNSWRDPAIEPQSDEPKIHQRHTPLAQARRFQLTRNSFLFPSHVEAGHGIQKRKTDPKKKLLVIMERNASRLRHPEIHKVGDLLEDPNHQDSPSMPPEKEEVAPEQTRLLKRPNATTQELNWRARTWRKIPSASKNDKFEQISDSESLALAEQLRKFSLQLTQRPTDAPPSLTDEPRMHSRPKSSSVSANQVPQFPNTSFGGDVIARSVSTDEDEYVYDTFVRAENPTQEAQAKISQEETSFQGTQPEKVGVLVIEDEDESTWQEHLEDVEDEKDWDSEDEDENGKYPLPLPVSSFVFRDVSHRRITDLGSGGLLRQ